MTTKKEEVFKQAEEKLANKKQEMTNIEETLRRV